MQLLSIQWKVINDHNKILWNTLLYLLSIGYFPDSKIHGANMGATWGRQDPGGPHVGPMNLAIRELISCAKNFSSIMKCLRWNQIPHHLRNMTSKNLKTNWNHVNFNLTKCQHTVLFQLCYTFHKIIECTLWILKTLNISWLYMI